MTYCPFCGRQHNVGFVSTRFAGTDGVSLETAKWADVFEGIGFFHVIRGGDFGRIRGNKEYRIVGSRVRGRFITQKIMI